MTKKILINKITQTLTKLPYEKVEIVSDFVNNISQKSEEEILQKGIQKLTSESKVFAFLEDEEDLYTVDDLIEKF